MGSRLDFHNVLKAIPDVQAAYFQPKPTDQLQYPCIVYEWDDEYVSHADNLAYFHKKRYQVIVINRNPDSSITDAVREIPYTRYVRHYVTSGLHHYVFNTYF